LVGGEESFFCRKPPAKKVGRLRWVGWAALVGPLWARPREIEGRGRWAAPRLERGEGFSFFSCSVFYFSFLKCKFKYVLNFV
jgi:hypothetical protein